MAIKLCGKTGLDSQLVAGRIATPGRRAGWSLLETLLAVAILGAIAMAALPRFSGQSAAARKNACYTLKGSIEVQARLWHRHKGSWPSADLSDMAADPAYLPEGLPVCPVDGSVYTLDAATHQVLGHVH